MNTDQHDCPNTKNENMLTRPMFVDCLCYDEYLLAVYENHDRVEFDCLTSDTRKIQETETEADICIVSMTEEGKVDFNSNFASTLSITWKATDNISDGEMTVTSFDVSCSGGLPVYPGYGKLSNTCPMEVSIFQFLKQS